jgi:hypothetical protein
LYLALETNKRYTALLFCFQFQLAPLQLGPGLSPRLRRWVLDGLVAAVVVVAAMEAAAATAVCRTAGAFMW